jgi:hypothetical protein
MAFFALPATAFTFGVRMLPAVFRVPAPPLLALGRLPATQLR